MDFTILAAPRISAAGFAAILAEHGSPAAPEAAACYAACVKAGVDPAVLLAVFAKESTYGKFGRAHTNRSWGNVRDPDRDGRPFPIDDKGFRRYPTWTAGAADAARLLAIYGANKIRPGHDTSTVQRFPYVWAPAADGNAPDRYGDFLARMVSAWSSVYRPGAQRPPAARTYRVRAGDTLYGIAAQLLGDGHRWPELYRDNRDRIGANPNMIHVGTVLRVPGA